MAGKSQRRHQPRSKKKKARHGSPAIAARQREFLQSRESAAPSKVMEPVAEMLKPKAEQTVARYPYIVAELRRIGILAGIMLAILVVLVLILA